MIPSKYHYKTILLSLKEGTYPVIYQGSKYLLSKHIYANDKIIKIYAKELKGKDIVSGNYFTTIQNGLLKPCEMSDKKVIDFIRNLEVI
jgi:hypothetical protein